MEKSVYYSDYLQLNKILTAQELESFKTGPQAAHDEMLFIVIHQTYELWFKQILVEVDSIIEIMSKPKLNDNSPELQTVVHRLSRVIQIFKVLIQQFDVLETMTPMDFLDFRDLLYPASGFQSWQFRLLEAKLGLKYDHRHGKEYYTSQLCQSHIQLIKEIENEKSLLELVNIWLERMPFFNTDMYWKNYHTLSDPGSSHPFWSDYELIYINNLSNLEKNNSEFFKTILTDRETSSDRSFSAKACRAALFIMLYRGYPMLELPFQLLNALLEIDTHLGTWRHKHLNIVRRTIGSRMGTGGSTGSGYLKGAMEKHSTFSELAQLSSFLINRRKIPTLPKELVQKLGYNEPI